MSYTPAEIIKKKKRGEANSDDEIRFMVEAFAKGDLPDYQMSAWAMAICFQNMNASEIAVLTESMLKSGRVMDFSQLGRPRVDKHSTGGVGDKTSMILGPIVAATGIAIPMLAGRGLGHTGGTLDKLESIPGFRDQLSYEEFESHVQQHFFSLMGQTPDICPADKKFYALRDVTGTVDSPALICGSIMSKKLAEDLTGLVLDVKFGSGAFMKTLDQAEELAGLLKSTGEYHNVKVVALLTSMNQPLGRFAGNALEIKECVDILKGESFEVEGIDYYQDTRDLSLALAGHMIWLGDQAQDAEQGIERARQILQSGEAYERFLSLCQYQGPARLEDLPTARHKYTVTAPSSGYVTAMNTELIGLACLELGAGRKTQTDSIDPTAGIEFNCRLNKQVQKGEPLAFLHASDQEHFQQAEAMFLSATTISSQKGPDQPLIAKIIQ